MTALCSMGAGARRCHREPACSESGYELHRVTLGDYEQRFEATMQTRCVKVEPSELHLLSMVVRRVVACGSWRPL